MENTQQSKNEHRLPQSEHLVMISELLDEIRQADTKLFLASLRTVKRGEKLLVTLTDAEDNEFLKKTWMLSVYYLRQAKVLDAQSEFDGHDSPQHAEMHRAGEKAALLNDMFWFLVKEKFHLWNEMCRDGGMSLRENWQIVLKVREPNPSDLLRSILGG